MHNDINPPRHVPAGRSRGLAERSKALVLLVPSADRRANAEVEQIRDACMQQFDQQSVLRADDLTYVSFTPAQRPQP